jgi:4-coumarate--CoA ligase
MTETTSAITLFYYPETDETGSVGSRFVPNTDVKYALLMGMRRRRLWS